MPVRDERLFELGQMGPAPEEHGNVAGLDRPLLLALGEDAGTVLEQCEDPPRNAAPSVSSSAPGTRSSTTPGFSFARARTSGSYGATPCGRGPVPPSRRPEDLVHERDEVAQRPEALAEHDRALRSGDVQDVRPRAMEHFHVRVPESVDRLLRIADDEQVPRAQIVQEREEDLVLEMVGVLIFVHQDV